MGAVGGGSPAAVTSWALARPSIQKGKERPCRPHRSRCACVRVDDEVLASREPVDKEDSCSRHAVNVDGHFRGSREFNPDLATGRPSSPRTASGGYFSRSVRHLFRWDK